MTGLSKQYGCYGYRRVTALLYRAGVNFATPMPVKGERREKPPQWIDKLLPVTP